MLETRWEHTVSRVRFGQQPPTNRRGFLTGVAFLAGLGLVAGGSLLRTPPGGDTFQKNPVAPEKVHLAEEQPSASAQFDNLVERYHNEAPSTPQAIETFQKKLEAIDKTTLTPEYKGLHMLFDHVLKRQRFDQEEGAALQRLGVDLETLKDQNESILPEKPHDQALARAAQWRDWQSPVRCPAAIG